MRAREADALQAKTAAKDLELKELEARHKIAMTQRDSARAEARSKASEPKLAETNRKMKGQSFVLYIFCCLRIQSPIRSRSNVHRSRVL